VRCGPGRNPKGIVRDDDLVYLTTEWLDASFSSETDVDTFYYTATYDGWHAIETMVEDDENPDTVVEVYDSEGVFKGYNDDYDFNTYESYFEFEAVEGKTYTIYVFEYYNWPGSDYEVDLDSYEGSEGIGIGGGLLGDYKIRILWD